MLAWQVFAGIAASALLAIGAVLIRKSRRPSQVVLVLFLVPIPAAGFVLYVVDPGPAPSLTVVTWIASLLVALAVYPAFWGRHANKHWQSSTATTSELTQINRHSLAMRACAVVGVSGYLLLFEPWFAIANLAVIAGWVASWIPARRRTQAYEVSGEIMASPRATFQFLGDPSNWTRYRTDILAVSTIPAGPLAVGTALTTRRNVPATGYGDASVPTSIEERSKITALSETSFTVVMLDRKATVSTELRAIESGTRITGRSAWVVAFTDAILGLGLEERDGIEAARQNVRRTYEKLNELLT